MEDARRALETETSPGGGWKLLEIGYPAMLRHLDYLGPGQDTAEGRQVMLSRVKLHLASAEYAFAGEGLQLPEGLTVRRVLSEYLAEMGAMAVKEIQAKLGAYIRKSDIQWCLTVPAIWEEPAKQEMKRIAEAAGLIGPGASPHPLLIVLEPEAAAVYCDRHMAAARGGIKRGDVFLIAVPSYDKRRAAAPGRIKRGDVFLIADVGGGTVDLIVQEKMDRSLREVSRGSGDLCGGTYVDGAFLEFLGDRIPCLERFLDAHPRQMVLLMSWWEQQKRGFNGAGNPVVFDLPARLAAMWEKEDSEVFEDRDRLIISPAELRSIFDPTLDKILALIDAQLAASPKCDQLFLVGGFSQSPYLIKRVTETFAHRVANIVTPPEPGTAICQGAVLFGLDPSIITERTSRKTYGIKCAREFRPGDPEDKKWFHDEDGCFHVSNSFNIFVRNGDQVLVDSEIRHSFRPSKLDQTQCPVFLLTTDKRDPRFADDDGVEEDFGFSLDMEDLPRGQRSFDVRMKFGATTIEVAAFRKGDDENPVEVKEVVKATPTPTEEVAISRQVTVPSAGSSANWLIETLSASNTPRHTSYPNHLNTSSSLVQLGDYIAYNNDIYDITNITDPGPTGNRTLVAYGAGHCTVVQAPVPANATNFTLFCHETFVFFAGPYANSTLAFQLIDGFAELPQPPDAILGGSGYFSGATGQITYVTSPYANVAVNGEVYFSVSLC
ncbi:Molecular chaperones HSP70/HSC70 [Klebsormidium nitens]|uniref:Molecular chaperones HSP70/HSC70 n=1 Tax=Klebsormidium nitens TaxID=105231 RepID=A0A1Y1IIT4_KLENI|nr:Molecular chaperones HSP70/HSC70 [Klebsormidium nitens]|eukprot:GAQ90012.1 Molecular chaperones HSP70/HSC70 [Klebsormidium nitens]